MEVLIKETKAFPKIFHVGAPEVTNLFVGPVEITEKVDGSQFGFGRVESGDLIMRSKGRIIFDGGIFHEDKLFKSAINHVVSVADKIKPGYFFYGEVLAKPQHNTLAYERTPRNFIALYGVLTPTGWVTDHTTLTEYATALDIDVVPLLYSGIVTDMAQLKVQLDAMSYLGKEKIEGIVVKNYNQFSTSPFSSSCYGKYVQEGFKERNGATNAKVKGNDLLELASSFATEARWVKAEQHLRDEGKLTYSPKDIGLLIPEVLKDLETEEGTYIKEALYKMFIKTIKGNTTKGLPEWWKNKLLANALPKQETENVVHETVEAKESVEGSKLLETSKA